MLFITFLQFYDDFMLYTLQKDIEKEEIESDI